VPLVHAAHAELLTGGKMFDVEYRFQRKDERWIWPHDRAVARYEQDGKRYTDGVMSDITQRKEAEQAWSRRWRAGCG
jgi:PAS domain S-box-containing protein